MIEIIKAIFYGIVEGITEWLPISSTGHLILFENFWHFNSDEAFIEMYRVVIQLGAILAVVVMFWSKIWPFGVQSKCKHGGGYIPQPQDKHFLGGFIFKWDIFIMWLKILVACIPTVIYGVLFDDTVSNLFKNNLAGTDIKIEFLVVTAMLLLVGVLFIVIENRNRNRVPTVTKAQDIDFKAAFIIGVFQVVAAALPGTSRSGATILGALIIGIARPAAAEFTFYLAIPVMFGASLLKGLKYVASGSVISSTEIAVLAVGCIVAFVVSLFVIKFLMSYIKKHDFKAFGWYRIALSVVLIAYLMFTVLK